ncbi:MAG: hypothetical protein HQL82_08660 [Magnetococcales bacterium]|nr:hypothetical protein [Magnetococcales bacterium]
MNAPTRNPLFHLYGSSLLAALNPDSPRDREAADHDRDPQVSGEAARPGHPAPVSEAVKQGLGVLRQALLQERSQPSGTAPPAGSLRAQLDQFRQGLKTGDETGLANNPLHLLTRQMFLDALQTLGQRLAAVHAGLWNTLPLPGGRHPTLKDIWTGPRRPARITARLAATLALGLTSIKPPLVTLLFCGSTLTTAWGVNELVQTPLGESLFGGQFAGEEGEAARSLLAVAAGVLLSSAILDFKGRIFRNMAEGGGVLAGIRSAILRNPRWMILAGGLAMVSIKTNYDGFVTLFSKQLELGNQVDGIRRQVHLALGTEAAVADGQTDSLQGLQVRLERTVADVLRRFHLLPEDEKDGRASSQIAYPGPRYWGKFYIIHGGYDPGHQNVRQAFGDRPLAGQIDWMLTHSGLDLSQSVHSKAAALVERNRANLQATAAEVGRQIDELDELLHNQRGLIPGLNGLFFTEHYQINEVVNGVVATLETQRQAYDGIMSELQTLVSSYVPLLEQVDKSGGARFADYRIDVAVAPEIAAIEALKQQRIPLATHKSIKAMSDFFAEHYGVVWAHLVLATVLALAVGMDLADLILLARRTARMGRRDRKAVVGALGAVLEWEEAFISGCQRYFEGRSTREMLPGLAMPNRRCLQDTFYRMLEEIDPVLKDPQERSWPIRGLGWFTDLFLTVRINDMHHCEARAKAIRAFAEHREAQLARLIARLFPGLDATRLLAAGSLGDLFHEVEAGQVQNQQRFTWEYDQVHGVEQPDTLAASDTWQRLPATLEKLGYDHGGRTVLQHLLPTPPRMTLLPGGSLGDGNEAGGVLPTGLLTLGRLLFWQAPLAPLADFAHTRRNWLQGLPPLNSEGDEIMRRIRGTLPELERIRENRLPEMAAGGLRPLMDITGRLPDRLGGETVRQVRELGQRWSATVQEFKKVSDLCRHIDQSKTVLYSGISGTDLDHLAERVLPRATGSSLILADFQEFQHAVAATLKRVKALEEQVGFEVKRRAMKIDDACGDLIRCVITRNMRKRSAPRRLAVQDGEHPEPDELLKKATERATDIQHLLERVRPGQSVLDDRRLDMLQDLETEAQELVGQVRKLTHFLTQNPFQTTMAAGQASADGTGLIKESAAPRPAADQRVIHLDQVRRGLQGGGRLKAAA